MTQPLLILDGGMGRELLRRGAPFAQPEWSALALMEAPAAVLDVHAAFIAASADVITSNSYSLVPFHIGEERFRARAGELAALAGQLARQAVIASGKAVKVAGSLPPLFGSYRPDLFDAALALARAALDAAGSTMRLGVYANAFAAHGADEEALPANDGLDEIRADLTPAAYLDWARRWREAGADIIGGCCGVGPEHIAALATLSP